jgi:uncharacterized coiled-coil protein SlyX
MTRYWEAQLSLVSAHIADAERQIAQQRQLIEELNGAGHSTEEAEKTLALVVTLVTTLKEMQATIRRQLARCSIH